MIPDGWSEEKLGALFEFKNGANTEAVNYGSGTKFVNVMDVFLNDSLTCDKIRDSVNLPEKKIALYMLKMGDVLFNRTSEVFDEIALSTVYLDSKPAIFGGFVIRGRPSTDRLDPTFCIYCFSSASVRKELIRRGQGAIRANIGQADMKHVPLLVPSIHEQIKIANILSTWDKAIETVEKLTENSRAQKNALMQQLLTGKKRFFGFNSEWKYLKLETLIQEKKRKGKIVETNNNGNGQPYIGSSSFDGEFILYTESKDAVLCETDDILILWDGENAGKSATGLVGVVSSTVVRFRLNKKLANNGFINNCIIFDNYKLRAIREGSGIPHMPGDFEHWYKINTPTLKEQQKISAVFTTADYEIDTMQLKLDCLKQEKKALMQQLLTGKCHVKVCDKEQDNGL